MSQIGCDWHVGQSHVRASDPIECPECGRLFETSRCAGCKREFLVFDPDKESRLTEFVATPTLMNDGSLRCVVCKVVTGGKVDV